MRWQQVTQRLHGAIDQMTRQERHFAKDGIHTPFQGKEHRHFVGAQFVDHHKSIFAIHFRNIENIAMHVLTRHRQIFEIRQHMPTQFGQHLWLVGADIEDLR